MFLGFYVNNLGFTSFIFFRFRSPFVLESFSFFFSFESSTMAMLDQKMVALTHQTKDRKKPIQEIKENKIMLQEKRELNAKFSNSVYFHMVINLWVIHMPLMMMIEG